MPPAVSSAVRAPHIPVERFRLANGLRVVVAPDRSAPAVLVAVFYDVGFRSEPEGRTGFAHLFEHLMFEGSANVAKMDHARLIQGNGGVLNGSTTPDYTNYFEELPSHALELALFLEADRMASPNLTEETLENQIAVVKEEIRVNVLNRPYGGFPWIHLPPVLYRTFHNAHNGYGSFEDLEAATVADAQSFFAAYYAPGNAVLVVAGDTDPDEVSRLVDRHFGDIPGRAVPPPAKLAEPLPTAEVRGVHHDPMAPLPALAVGYRVPDPLGDPAAYLAVVLLADVLTDGEASRLHQRLVERDRLVANVVAYLGPFADPFALRDPTQLQVMVHHPPTTSPDAVLDAIDEEVARLAEDLTDDELARVVTSWTAAYLRHVDDLRERGMSIAVFEQQREDPGMISDLVPLLGRVSAADVREAAARWLGSGGRAVLEWRAG